MSSTPPATTLDGALARFAAFYCSSCKHFWPSTEGY